jgi:hypothetical protein
MLTEPWILLRLRLRNSGIWAECEDDQGLRYSSKYPWEWRSVALGSIRLKSAFLLRPPQVRFFLPAVLGELISEKIARLRSRPANPDTRLPAPLPIFLWVPPALSAFSWELVVAEILKGDIQVVRLARLRERWRPRLPFRLPLRVHTVDKTAEISLLRRFRTHDWLALEDVQRFGLEIGNSEDRHFHRFQAGQGPDILLCDAGEAVDVLRRVGRIREIESRPRLILVTSHYDRERDLLAPLHRPPSGTSLVWASTSRAPELVDKLLYAIIHDQPLHEAVKRVSAPKLKLTSWPPLLISDPAGVEDLRMADALGEFVEESAELESRLLPGNVEAFLQHALPDCPPQLKKAMWDLDRLAQPMRKAVSNINFLKVNFGQEANGMVPLAESQGDLSRAREGEDQIVQVLRTISSDAESRATIAKHQERRLDVVLRRLDRSPFPRPWVMPHETLRRGARYRVRVHIGRTLKLSLVTGEVPALDPLLPELPDEGAHLLHVALFGLDFKVSSESLLPLRLPPLGGSDPVSFDIVAPWRTGKATLRIALYYDLPPGPKLRGGMELHYHNHLIQSFLLEAQVDEEERFSDEGTRVRLEFSQTERFSNLAALTTRVLSLGLNDGPGSATHTLMAKRGAKKEEIHLEEAVLEKQLTGVRKQLDAATWNDARRGPRFPEAAAGRGREGDFDSAVRGLVRVGKELSDQIW